MATKRPPTDAKQALDAHARSQIEQARQVDAEARERERTAPQGREPVRPAHVRSPARDA